MKGSFAIIENDMMLLNLSNGDLYKIESSILSRDKNIGDLTLMGKLKHSEFGFYYNDKYIVFEDEDRKYKVGQY
jgi:hypothetical protein